MAGAATVSRNPSTATTPNAADFPATYNNHPFQVGYSASTTVDSGDNHMFRDTIPIICEKGQRVAGASLSFMLVKIRNGANAGDNDSLNFWVNGQKKYELNVGKAATPGIPAMISLDLGALPPINQGPNTVTATYSSLPNLSMIPDIRASQRLSIGIQDDTDINFATVNYTCEKDPDFVPEPIPADPCCPPWNSTNLANSLQYVGSGPISAPYTLKFTPSPGLIAALQGYLNYIHLTNSSLTDLLIEFQLYDQGVSGFPPGNGTAVGPVSGMKLTANSTSVQLHTNYNTNTPAIFTGVSTPGTSTTPSSYPMQVGRWYLVHTGMWTDKIAFFDKAKCANVDVKMRITFIKVLHQAAPKAMLELIDRSGKTKTIPLDGSGLSLAVPSPSTR
jgi:hypothetical protein